MYILKNTLTKQFFCEFAEHLSLDTKDVNEAAEFEKVYDAELLMPQLTGTYVVVPKMEVVKKQRHQ